jgi:predicted nucleic-acid-binding protein
MEDKSVIQKSLSDYAKKNVDFIDAYLVTHAKENPPEEILTWDKYFKKLDAQHNRPKNW